MKRKIYEKLKEWKILDNGSSAVLINGARRVGKSYIAEEFAKNEYRNYLLIDFAKAKDDERVMALCLPCSSPSPAVRDTVAWRIEL